MKKRICVFFVVVGTFSVLLLLACGGGGGGGPAPPPVYTGITSPASLDSGNEAGQFAYALLFPSVPTDIVPLSLSGGRTFLHPSVTVKSLIRGILDRAINPATASDNARPLKTYPPYSEYGMEGGTVNITVTTGVWSNQVEYVTRITAVFSSFDDVPDGIANPIDGRITITPDTWTSDGMPVYFVATFDLHLSIDPDTGARMAGSLDYRQMGTDDMRQVSTWNALLIDDATKIEIWENPLIQVDEDYLNPSRVLLTVSGRVYLSFAGYVDVSPLAPFDYPSVETDLMPVSGSVLLTGDGTPAATAIVTVSGTAPEVQVDLDIDGDSVTDETAWFSWNELTVF